MVRRTFLSRTSSTIAGSLLLPRLGIATASAGQLPAGTVASSALDTLPDKRPLMRRTFRPPNFETPVELFRDAYTTNNNTEWYASMRWAGEYPEAMIYDASNWQ